MKQAEFAELSREVMPVLDKLTEIAGQHVGVQGTLFSEWIDGGRTLR